MLVGWLLVSFSSHHVHVKSTALREARNFIERDLAFRTWGASHGGVYVPATDKTPPNPYLAHIPDRDLHLADNKTLTLINPAYMMRQINEDFSQPFGIKGHITSLKPIRPENGPDDWERQALEILMAGQSKEVIDFTSTNGEEALRLMQPIVTEEACLKCHGHQGYQEGDIRGGLSTTIPLRTLIKEAQHHNIYWGLALLVLWLLGLAGIWFSSRRVITEIEARDSAYNELASHQAHLEETIRARTRSVAEANNQLAEEVKERAKVQSALQKSHGELQQIFNSAADGFRIIDWDHNMVKFNDTFTRMTGGSRQNLSGRKCYEVFPGPFCQTEECPLTQAKKGNPKTIQEVNKTTLDGHPLVCLCQSTLFYDANGQAMGILENFRDITTIKELEGQLSKEAARSAQQAVELQQKHTDTIKQNIELEQALNELKATQSQMLQNEKMATVGQLAAGVAHEINNPTGFVTSNLSSLEKYVQRLTDFVALLQEAVAPEKLEEISRQRKKMKIDHINADIHDLIRESLDGTERIKKIVMSLKNFSRTDHEEYGPADINDCLESTLNVVWNELKYKATVEKEYGELPQIQCYAQQLNQVFMNLLVNGAQAIEEQGVITIKTWHDEDNVFISIADTGKGMDEQTLAHIFEPFFTTKPELKGTGLGLPVSYGIIKKHGGRIDVKSESGKGSKFSVFLPVKSENYEQ